MLSSPDRPEPGLRRLTAGNPSPMTYRGTNTYLVGIGDVAVIDPGPDDPAHLSAILAALGPGEQVSHILVTHSHLDHSPLAHPLSERTGAPVFAFGTHADGRRPIMQRLAAEGAVGGGEGIDRAFAPDHRLQDGEIIAGETWRIQAIWTPGHTANHMCFAWNDALFTGDHVMGWASSLISPPDGDLAAFLESCARLATRGDRVFYPGHGDPVPDPAARLAWLVAHRRDRERQILDALSLGPASITELARRIYTDTPVGLLPAAERNILAHVIDLSEKRIIRSEQFPFGLLHLA